MLSHLVGSSNRADIARLSELEFELADALEKNKSLIVRNQEKLNKLRKEIDINQQTLLFRVSLQKMSRMFQNAIYMENVSFTSVVVRATSVACANW
jgi:predicted transcriptional regulator